MLAVWGVYGPYAFALLNEVHGTSGLPPKRVVPKKVVRRL